MYKSGINAHPQKLILTRLTCLNLDRHFLRAETGSYMTSFGLVLWKDHSLTIVGFVWSEHQCISMSIAFSLHLSIYKFIYLSNHLSICIIILFIRHHHGSLFFPIAPPSLVSGKISGTANSPTPRFVILPRKLSYAERNSRRHTRWSRAGGDTARFRWSSFPLWGRETPQDRETLHPEYIHVHEFRNGVVSNVDCLSGSIPIMFMYSIMKANDDVGNHHFLGPWYFCTLRCFIHTLRDKIQSVNSCNRSEFLHGT